ncbi:DsrE family protein [Alteromonas sp. ASW11-36]|uniref:DsrE family protein n=1 Tax=Alteromonas arenosi TaxID=3055817 RepID=A0ABT7SSM9_9ALTE|nr:DsrE family protein [Alteromonas sp. ASW11-36]MDM7859185.1 DsrE family protein [Alteromonas sp. ASW11-36]
MQLSLTKLFFSLGAVMLTSSLHAQLSVFADGPLITGFGKHGPVEKVMLPEGASFKVAFDVVKAAEPGEVNRQFDSLARFINMHVANGVKPENIELALVVHGKASLDLLDHPTFQKAFEMDNPNRPLLEALMANQVQVILCGQSATAYEINRSQLIDGVQMHLSAMTAHALLQQQGYTVNPF